MEEDSEDGFPKFQKEESSSEDEQILESEVVEFEEEEKMEEFEIGKFKKLMYKLKNREEPRLEKLCLRNQKSHVILKLISTLTTLRTIKIPSSVVHSEQLIDRTQGFLYHKESWFSAMLLIRKLEQKNGNFAPKLKESIEMKEMWKEARIQKMKDELWVEDLEKREKDAEKEREERKRRDRNHNYHSYSNPVNHQRNRNKKRNEKKKEKPKNKMRYKKRTVESYSNGLFGAVGSFKD